jgi:hypothetical protein
MEVNLGLNDDPLMFVERMITWFYTQQYTNFYSAQNHDSENAIAHAGMYAFASQLDIPRLEEAAAASFKSVLKIISESDSEIDFLAELLRIVYEETHPDDPALRAPVQEFIRKHRLRVLAKEVMLEYALRNRDFGHDLLRIIQESRTQESEQDLPRILQEPRVQEFEQDMLRNLRDL